MYLSYSKYQEKIYKDSYDENTCKENVQQADLALERQDCDIMLPSLAWYEPIIINVTGYVNGIYDSKDRISYLKFKGQRGDVSLGLVFPWDDIETPVIKVNF